MRVIIVLGYWLGFVVVNGNCYAKKIIILCLPITEHSFVNLFAAEFSQKMPFLPLNEFFGCNDSKLALILTKK